MNIDDLLSDVEDVMQNTSSRKNSFNTKSVSDRHGNNNAIKKQSSLRSATHQKDNVDDLLDMIGDTSIGETTKTIFASTSKPRDAGITSSTKKRCVALVLSGADSKRGANLRLNANTACDKLRCTSCDFHVAQFIGKKWDPNCAYMFFRENMPDERKLAKQLLSSSDMVAYCCQCTWKSIDNFEKITSDSGISWVCSGHSA